MRKLKLLLTGNKKQLSNYVNALKQVNVKPVFSLNEKPNGLLLTGGGDLSPCFYGQLNFKSQNVNLNRDCFEFFLIKKFLSHDLPVFGICRGLQVINVFFGGSLCQHIEQNNHCQIDGIDQMHANKSINGSFCQKIYGKYFLSNSAHHQKIDNLGKGLKVSATALDGTIEAIEGKNVFALQFHPERMEKNFLLKTFYYFHKKLALKSANYIL